MNNIQIVSIVIVLILLSIAWVQFGLPYVKTWTKARTLKKAHAYLKNNEYEKAVAELEGILDLRDLNSPVFVSLFTLLISRDNFKKAEEILDRVPDDIKRTDNYLLQRGYLFYLQKDFPAARSLFESIIQKESDMSPLALSNLGALVVQEGNNPREAINLLKQALSINKGNSSNYGIYFNLSLAYLQLKEFNEAIVHAEVGIDLLPKDGFGSNRAYAHHILSLGYKGMGKMKEARKELMLAIEFSPHGAGRLSLEKELEVPVILNWEEALELVNTAKSEGKSVVFTNGCFDIIHAGHIDLLERISRLGDMLIIGMNSDMSVRRLKGARRPLTTQSERAEILDSLTMVDVVIVFDNDTPSELIEYIKPNVLVKGGDYGIDEIAGRDTVFALGGRVLSLPLLEGKSTTAIISLIVERYCT